MGPSLSSPQENRLSRRKKSLRMAVTEELTYDPIALLRESSGQQLHKCSVTLKLV